MVRDAVVGVGEVPKIVGDDPGPDHVGPDHVLRGVLRNEDAEPAADRDDVQDAGDAVHDVPRARYRPEVLNDAALPQREAEHLEVADDRLGDVDRQDERREAQRPALLVQVVGLAVLAAPFHEAQGDEPEAPCQRGIGLHPVEPGARAVLVAGGGGYGPHEQGERSRHDREQGEPAPQLDAPQLVEGHQGEENEEPNDPVNRIGCLVEDAHGVSFRRHVPARFRSGNAACDAPVYGPICLKSSKCRYRNFSQKDMICAGHFAEKRRGVPGDDDGARLWEDDAAAGGRRVRERRRDLKESRRLTDTPGAIVATARKLFELRGVPGDLHRVHREGGERHPRAYLLPLREPQRAD